MYTASRMTISARRVVHAIAHDCGLHLAALLCAVWRRKPKHRGMIHSDQGSQFTNKEWQSFIRKHNLEASMSRRGICHDNAMAESYFQLLKRERIRRWTSAIRDAARQDVFDYIVMSCTRQHASTQTMACGRRRTTRLPEFSTVAYATVEWLQAGLFLDGCGCRRSRIERKTRRSGLGFFGVAYVFRAGLRRRGRPRQ